MPSGKITFMSSFKNLIDYPFEALYIPCQPSLPPPHLILSIFSLQILFFILGNDFTCATVWNDLLKLEQIISTACFVQKIIISKRDSILVWHIYSASYPASYFHSCLYCLDFLFFWGLPVSDRSASGQINSPSFFDFINTFKGLPLLAYSALHLLGQLAYWNPLPQCVSCADFCLLYWRLCALTLWEHSGLEFSFLIGEESHSFHFHCFFLQFSTLFYLPFPDFFSLLVTFSLPFLIQLP